MIVIGEGIADAVLRRIGVVGERVLLCEELHLQTHTRAVPLAAARCVEREGQTGTGFDRGRDKVEGLLVRENRERPASRRHGKGTCRRKCRHSIYLMGKEKVDIL